MNINKQIETAREFVHSGPHTKAQWALAMGEVLGLAPTPQIFAGLTRCAEPMVVDYMVDHSHYRSASSARGAYTRTLDNLQRAEAKRFCAEVRPKLYEILDTHEHMRQAYFMRPPARAEGRRSFERTHSFEVSFELPHTFDRPVAYEIKVTTRCSTKNVYYQLEVLVNGEAKNVSAIRGLLNVPSLNMVHDHYLWRGAK